MSGNRAGEEDGGEREEGPRTTLIVLVCVTHTQDP